MKKSVKVFALIQAACLLIVTLSGCVRIKKNTSSSADLPSALSSAVSSEDASVPPSVVSDDVTSQASVSGLRWVLVDSSYQTADDIDNAYHKYTVTYEGVSDNKVIFKSSGGYYQDGKNYYRCDAYFGCQQPPAVLEPEQTVSLEMDVKVENYEFASSTGNNNEINLNACWVQGSGKHFYDKDNNDYLDCRVSGNCYRSLVVTGTMGRSTTPGARYEIKFCGNSCGTYTWTYELQE